jgi:hypothetical protein
MEIAYLAVSDYGILDDDVLKARIEREARSTHQFVENTQKLQSLASFHEWIHLTHLCYAVPRQTELGIADLSPGKALASY